MQQSSTEAFLSEIEAFLAHSGISASAFGRAAVADPNFVGDLRTGRAPSLRLVDRARDYIASQPSTNDDTASTQSRNVVAA